MLIYNSTTNQVEGYVNGAWGQIGGSGGGTITGEVRMYAGGSSPPSGWLFCDGSAVSRTTYADLYNVIGTEFGAGDGSTTFNVPDLRGRAPIGVGTGTGGGASGNGAPTGGSALTARTKADWGGKETHVLSDSELPNHTHGMDVRPGASGSSGAVYPTSGAAADYYATGGKTGTSGQAHQNMQPFMTLRFIIKT